MAGGRAEDVGGGRVGGEDSAEGRGGAGAGAGAASCGGRGWVGEVGAICEELGLAGFLVTLQAGQWEHGHFDLDEGFGASILEV